MTEPTGLTEQQLKDYAEHLIDEHSKQIEFLSVFEMYEAYTEVDGVEISEEDARKVLDFANSAIVEISWSDDLET